MSVGGATSCHGDCPTVDGGGDHVIIRHDQTALGNNHARALVLRSATDHFDTDDGGKDFLHEFGDVHAT